MRIVPQLFSIAYRMPEKTSEPLFNLQDVEAFLRPFFLKSDFALASVALVLQHR
jgi:hypothetical protein